MTGTKYELKNFNGKINFSLWQRKMKDVLIKQRVYKTLLGKMKKLQNLDDDEREDMNTKASNVIRLYLSGEVMIM